MTFKEKTESLRKFLKGLMKEDMSPEELEEFNKHIAGINELDQDYDKSETDRVKYRDKIVNMVMTEGSDRTPADEHDGSKPMSIDEAVAQVMEKGGK